MLLTKEIISKLEKYPLGSKDNDPNPEIIVKFFTPWSNWSWFATEGSKQPDGDWQFFGMVHGHEKELGYFNLSELESIKGAFGLKIERDRGFKGHLSDVQ